jgi:2-polyprenyl-3-methyl-5-hydroxy-6-metoxy-1,4-benzoquinol methylase
MMEIDRQNDTLIIESWVKNAAPWTIAVRECKIESRNLITNRAIVETITKYAPKSILDIGCGEGWLVRALDDRGMLAAGIDGIPTLIDRARQAGGGEFYLATYAEIATGKISLTADAIVCNFSLFGDRSVDLLLAAMPSLLNNGGNLFVQTLHPIVANGNLPYRSGWRSGDWAGCDGDFTDPAPWYFRTISAWIDVFSRHQWQVTAIDEPIHPHTHVPASIIFSLRLRQ